MPEYQVLSLKKADKELSRVHPKDKNKALDFFQKLKSSPFPQNVDIIKMSGSQVSYRAKIGKLRIIYVVIHEEKRIIITRVRYRKTAYRN